MNTNMNTNQKYGYEKIIEYRDCLSSFMSGYDWDWFVSLNLPTSSIEDTEKYLKQWRCKCSTKYHIQISYIGIIITSQYTGNHIHLLMFGRNKDGKTLLDMDEREWEREWNDITHKGSYIERVRDDGVFEYMVEDKNTPINHFELLTPYNTKLLNKHRKD